MAEMNTTIIIITIHLHILKIAIVHLFVSSNIIIMYYWQNVHFKTCFDQYTFQYICISSDHLNK